VCRIFLRTFWRKIWYFFLRETSLGAPGRTGNFAGARLAWNLPGSAAGHIVGGSWQFQNQCADTEHGNATGPANRATFQSTGPRAVIFKLEYYTCSLRHSTVPCKEGEEAIWMPVPETRAVMQSDEIDCNGWGLPSRFGWQNE
jgi:hypothetical protein